MSNRKQHSFRPTLTVLEGRDMPNVSAISLSTAGILTVKAGPTTTDVTITESATGALAIKDSMLNHTWSYAATAKIGEVNFVAGSGTDTIIATNAEVNPAKIKFLELIGGSGTDKFTSSGFPVSMVAGSGNDTLSAPSGNATLVGGGGQDYMIGGSGDDLIEAGSGNDYMNGGTGVATLVAGIGNDTIVAMNGQASDTVVTGPGTAVIWSDSVNGVTDNIIGNTTDVTIQAVASFANGPSTILDGGTFTEPKLLPTTPKATYEAFKNRPLFSPSGPSAQDVSQYISKAGGGVAGTGTTLDDSWLLAGLAAIAQEDPQTLEKNVVDFGDGTYGVDLGGNYYRVDNMLPVNIYGETYSAYGSVTSSMWVPIVEKAFAYYFSVYGPASYSNLVAANGGTTPYVFAAFGASQAGTVALNGALGYSSQAALGQAIFSLLYQNYSTCIGLTAAVNGTDSDTGAAVALAANREYTVMDVALGPTGQVVSVTLRDPDGANPDGVVVTLANLYAASGTLDSGNP